MNVIDIGCGRKKITGSIGIDFSELSDADILLDLNTERLPFEDNSVDFIYSSHTLEHLSKDGFFNVMSEMYRILKPNAQVKIVVPYFGVQANWANPYHNNDISFNEHTFRFFSSDYSTDALSPEEYRTPSCPQWGLRYSANSELAIEFKTLDIKFFYFPEYRFLPGSERRTLRATNLNVVDQISYSLLAIKPCPLRPETGPVADGNDPYKLIKSQIKFLQEQILYLQERNLEPEELGKIRSLGEEIERVGDLFSVNGYITPVDQLVYEVDDAIQYLRHYIDQAN